MYAFRTRTGSDPEPSGGTATLPSRKERLAIVASGGKLCGIAAYAAALSHHLNDAFDVTLFPLDQYLMRSTHRRVRPLARPRNQGYLPRALLLRRGQSATRIRHTGWAPNRHLSPVPLGRRGGAAVVGDLSYAVAAGAV